MKQRKEYYILIAFTLFISVIIITGFFALQEIMGNFFYPQDQNMTINDTAISFTLTNKYFESNDSYSIIRGHNYYFENQIDLQNLEFKKTYLCNATGIWDFLTLSTNYKTFLSDCKENY